MENKVFNAVNKLIKINREHKRLIDANVADIGIHRTGHRILMYIARNNGTLPSQKKLSEFLEVTPAAITGSIQRLESDGYIKRKLGSDNRFNEIEITEMGRAAVEKTKVRFSAVDDNLFYGFSDEELDSFSIYLERILENIKGE